MPVPLGTGLDVVPICSSEQGIEGEDRLPVEPVDPTTYVVFDLDDPVVVIDHGKPRAIKGRGLAILEVDGQHLTHVLLPPESGAFSSRYKYIIICRFKSQALF